MADKKKQVVVVGADKNRELAAKAIKELEESGHEIVNIEETDIKIEDINDRYVLPQPDPYMLEMRDVQDMLYADVPKKDRGRIVHPVRTEPKIQNNEPCPCGSGKKYKKCCK